MYFKIENDAVVSANTIYNAAYELTAENHAAHAYPVDGWYWFDTLDAALAFFAGVSTSEAIPRWKGRAYLASQIPVEVGPLAAFSGTTLLDQIDAFVAASFSPVQRERYLGADPWHRNDPMITDMGTLLGLSDVQIDDWFKAAESFA